MQPADLLLTESGERLRIGLQATGALQGVGFRPFVYRLATSEGLGGFVRNTHAGVAIEVEGSARAVDRFLERIERETRPPALIERLERTALTPTGENSFTVVPSSAAGAVSAVVLPDLAMCEACLAEMRDPSDHRHRYPFTTCMHCGPRYSIIEALPYDRERTVMRRFPMCGACQAEYDEPSSRRFHAETNACPECGPRLALLGADGSEVAVAADALDQAAAALREGRVVALKGLGCFQLLVDARNEAVVARLRQRKRRPAKPFAVMAESLAEARAIAHVSVLEEELLRSPAAPILLLEARHDAAQPLAPSVAPANPDIGLMLPSTPLHHLLMEEVGFPLVATSGNRSGEPAAASDREAFARLSGIADLFLTHDRPILRPVDDSVGRVIAGELTVLRCARGYAPLRLADPRQDAPLIALGGHLKNSVAVAGNGRIVLGPHVGDLTNSETRAAFTRSIEGMADLHGIAPRRIACDAHPDYYTTQLADEMEHRACKVQHHLAHVLAAMVDNGLEDTVLGVAWDGTGDGGDGTIWGGEFLAVDGECWHRVAHLQPFRLPGGEVAMREPRRAAIGALHATLGDALWEDPDRACIAAFDPRERAVLSTMLTRGVNAPRTSSAGRLFDAVSSLLGLCQCASFEGEAAMAVEFAAGRAREVFVLPPPVPTAGGEAIRLDWRPMLGAMDAAFRAGVSREALAAGFHDWLSQAIVAVARTAGIERIVLTGGCFQNALLAERASERLELAGFTVFRHRRVPPNDGGLAVGQAAFATREMMREKP